MKLCYYCSLELSLIGKETIRERNSPLSLQTPSYAVSENSFILILLQIYKLIIFWLYLCVTFFFAKRLETIDAREHYPLNQFATFVKDS